MFHITLKTLECFDQIQLRIEGFIVLTVYLSATDFGKFLG